MQALKIIEIFTSIQGEGERIGRLSTFIRLAGCNLRCSWCDTTYSWKPGEMAPSEAMEPITVASRVNAPDVVVTGGEPLLHDLSALLDHLSEKFITVETNATRYRPDARVNLWSLSPKLGSSGHSPDLEVIKTYLRECPKQVQLKFVVGDHADVAEVKRVVCELPAVATEKVPLILQPVGAPTDTRDAYCEKMRILIEETLLPDPFWRDYALRFLPQFHQLVWGDRRGI